MFSKDALFLCFWVGQTKLVYFNLLSMLEEPFVQYVPGTS